jgi:RNA:NAD 2'-phosphotransferase (TPT1/KptA family)
MHGAGIPFFRSANGVWLTDAVPAIYLTKVEPPHMTIPHTAPTESL